MKLSRRDLLAGASVASLFMGTPKLAEAWLHPGSAGGGGASALSQRSIINLGFLFENDYAFINHLKQGDGALSPEGGAWSTTPTFNSVIDANGYVNTALNQNYGCIFRVPDPAVFAGPYTVDFVGNGFFSIAIQNGGTGSWTIVGTPSNCTPSSSGSNLQCFASAGSGSGSFQFTFSSTSTGPQPLVINIDPQTTSPFIKNIRVYRTADASDLAAGNVFRAPFKQSLVNLNPSAIRFLNWCAGSDNNEYRFENRALPTNAGYTTQSNWPVSPNYASAVTGTNIYTVASATPTASNPKTTPVSFQHGEIAEVLFTNANVRGGEVSVTAISNATNCQVTAPSHPFANGDLITLMNLGGSAGMGNLNLFPVTVSNVTTNTFTIGVNTSNTTTYPPYSGSGAIAVQYCTINIGSRGAKVIAQPDGSGPTSFFGNFIPSGQSIPLVYDKNVALQSDGNGNMIFGAWLTSTGVNPSAGAPFATTPLEIMVALVNEVNAMSVTQGINNPVHMYLTLPFTGLCTMDPDYSTSSDYALNAIDVILNPSSTLRVSGYSALNSKCKLFLEYDNETWNTAGGITGTPYLNRMGFLRWPTSGANDAVDMYILRSTLIMRAIGATSFASRIVRVLGGMGIAGFSPSSLNFLRCFGSSTPGVGGNFYTTDTLVTSGGWGTPISNHDAFCTATYFDPSNMYYGLDPDANFTSSSSNITTSQEGNITLPVGQKVKFTNPPSPFVAGTIYFVKASSPGNFSVAATLGGTAIVASATQSGTIRMTGQGTFVDDSAMYNGTDNSANGGGNYSGAANQSQAITNFVAKVRNQTIGDEQSINLYLDGSLNGNTAVYAAAMNALGKTAINYEGGTDWAVAAGTTLVSPFTGITLLTYSSGANLFLTAVIDSTQWATEQVGYFNRTSQLQGSAMPSVYTYLGSGGNQRWAYTQPDSYGGTSTEGQGLLNSPVWVAMSSRNQALPN